MDPSRLSFPDSSQSPRLIPLKSERQTMDYALVLASQGLDVTPTHSHEEGWGLLVHPQDQNRARMILDLYEKENRRWIWTRQWRNNEVLFHSGAFLWALVSPLIYALNLFRHDVLRVVGKMDSLAVEAGQWWRLFTAVWLHADAAHLLSNTTIGLLLVGLAMPQYGAGLTTLLCFLAGAGGNIAGYGLYSNPYIGLGASGMVMGALGLNAVQILHVHHFREIVPRTLFSSLAGATFILVLLGFSPGTDWVAHLGGFASGILLGSLCAFLPKHRIQSTSFQAACLGMVVLVFLLSWLLAFQTA